MTSDPHADFFGQDPQLQQLGDEFDKPPEERTKQVVAWPPPGYRTGDTLLDAPVQATHLDAAGAKAVCADLGYFQDPWIRQIVPAYVCGRKSPIMHRGYYLRNVAMRLKVEQFIKNSNPSLPIQIVDLGAGLNTMYFYTSAMMEQWGRKRSDLLFFEVDFPVIIAKKTKTILQKRSQLFKFDELIFDKPSGTVQINNATECTVRNSVHKVEQLKLLSKVKMSGSGNL